MIQSIIRSSKLKHLLERKIQVLQNRLAKLNNRIANDPRLISLQASAEEIKDQIQEELQHLSEKWQIRSNAKWIKDGEKSTKYFFSCYKIRHSPLYSNKVRDPGNPTSSSQQDILDYIKNFYKSLYKAELIDLQVAEELLRNAPHISQDHNTILVKPFTEEEISNTIDNLPNNKSPGPDRLTYEFYKSLKDLLLPLLSILFNNVLIIRQIPLSWSKNIITLIPKKSNDLENISNWRPISLINSDAKIFMKILANRLNSICKDVITPYQQAFITSRSITDKALDILTILRNQPD